MIIDKIKQSIERSQGSLVTKIKNGQRNRQNIIGGSRVEGVDQPSGLENSQEEALSQGAA